MGNKPKYSIDKDGRYGEFGGRYIPELLVKPIQELEKSFRAILKDKKFKKNLEYILKTYAGRPTPLTEASKLAKFANFKGRLFLKREDLLHTGAHKLNNALGQCLLAKKMGKNRIIAETGAGQHGVATASACAYLGLECTIYMGSVDIKRQNANVLRMKLFGAEVKSVDTGSKTLKDAVNEAFRDYSENYDNTHYCLGSALGPHPYPEIVKYFQSVIGKETKVQCRRLFGRDPDAIIACVGGGSNAIGIFSPFINDEKVKLVGVEAGGNGNKLGEHAARFNGGKPGVLHGSYSYVLQDEHGQIASTHSISAGLDYPSIGAIHSNLFKTCRAVYSSVSDTEAVQALKVLSEKEGIIPALESAHAIAYFLREASNFKSNENIVINLSGRGDKDLQQLFDNKLVDNGSSNE